MNLNQYLIKHARIKVNYTHIRPVYTYINIVYIGTYTTVNLPLTYDRTPWIIIWEKKEYINSWLISLIPADKHGNATSENVKLGSLLLHQSAALLPQRSTRNPPSLMPLALHVVAIFFSFTHRFLLINPSWKKSHN